MPCWLTSETHIFIGKVEYPPSPLADNFLTSSCCLNISLNLTSSSPKHKNLSVFINKRTKELFLWRNNQKERYRFKNSLSYQNGKSFLVVGTNVGRHILTCDPWRVRGLQEIHCHITSYSSCYIPFSPLEHPGQAFCSWILFWLNTMLFFGHIKMRAKKKWFYNWRVNILQIPGVIKVIFWCIPPPPPLRVTLSTLMKVKCKPTKINMLYSLPYLSCHILERHTYFLSMEYVPKNDYSCRWWIQIQIWMLTCLAFLKICGWLLQEHAHYGHSCFQIKRGYRIRATSNEVVIAQEQFGMMLLHMFLVLSFLPLLHFLLLHPHTVENNFLSTSHSNWLVPWKVNDWKTVLPEKNRVACQMPDFSHAVIYMEQYSCQ